MPAVSIAALATSFVAGIISFLSPCVLPLVPGYVSYVGGRSLANDGARARWAALPLSMLFVLGFTTVFVVLGASATALGQLLLAYRYQTNIVAGSVIVLFGLLMIGVGLSMLRGRRTAEAPDIRLTTVNAGRLLSRLVPIGLAVGLAAGCFGIGGGFLLVPMLIYFLRVPTATVIGTSMVMTLITMTSATVMHAATNHLVDAVLALILMVGGVIGAHELSIPLTAR